MVVGVQGVVVGGASSLERNVISGNGYAGVDIIAAGLTSVLGNYIGTNITGSAAIGNAIGIRLTNDIGVNTIGGAAPGAANVISGQVAGTLAGTGSGIALFAGAAIPIVRGNLIGTTASGTSALGNAAHGIESVNAGRFTVDGGNTIAFNGGDGIKQPGGGALVYGNSIHSNGGLGISTNASVAATATVATVQMSGGTTITGSLLGSFTGSEYLVQLYANASCDPSGSGEGQLYLGSVTLNGSTGASVPFTSSFAASISATPYITATAMTSNSVQGYITTSAFSPCVAPALCRRTSPRRRT